jgi:hypothetical protein
MTGSYLIPVNHTRHTLHIGRDQNFHDAIITTGLLVTNLVLGLFNSALPIRKVTNSGTPSSAMRQL